MKFRFASAVLCLLAASRAFALDAYPHGPDAQLTPGQLCQRPNNLRYAERIPYCNRDVSSETKKAVIRAYDIQLGYHISDMDRGEFKIDHYIPLCMGGSNDSSNLWPQHKTVYELTDPVEQRLCELMAAGRMSQAEAVKKIRAVKNDLDLADEMLDDLRRQIGH